MSVKREITLRVAYDPTYKRIDEIEFDDGERITNIGLPNRRLERLIYQAARRA